MGAQRGMQGGGRKGGEDERRLGLMRDCMMRRPLPAVFGHLHATWHCRLTLTRPRDNAAAAVAARMMVPLHRQPSLAYMTTVVPRSPEQ